MAEPFKWRGITLEPSLDGAWGWYGVREVTEGAGLTRSLNAWVVPELMAGQHRADLTTVVEWRHGRMTGTARALGTTPVEALDAAWERLELTVGHVVQFGRIKLEPEGGP